VRKRWRTKLYGDIGKLRPNIDNSVWMPREK